MRSEITKCGNSLALRLPKFVAAAAGFSEGTPVELSVKSGKFIIARRDPTHHLAPCRSRGDEDEGAHRVLFYASPAAPKDRGKVPPFMEHAHKLNIATLNAVKRAA